jgi:quercetin dioxygenase-like cupin family protein
MDSKEIAKQSLNKTIDELEASMVENFPIIDCPVKHHFTEGLYVREIFMPAGSLITSKIHITQHQYFVLKGKAIVWIDGIEHIIEAPFVGVTEPNTRRVLYIIEDSIWVTSHPNEFNENLEQIEARIIEKHDNPHLSLEIKERLNNLLNEKI